MKFIIENISKSSGRLGLWVQTETGTQLKTPILLQTTKSGSIPYLSRDVFEHVSKDVQLLQMSMATMGHMAESLNLFRGGGLGAYVGYCNYPTLLVVRDPCEITPSGFNDKDVVPLFTRRGKEMLSAQKYMDMVETFTPNIYQGLSDADTSEQSSKKRVQKSVDRTQQFMNYCIGRHENSEQLRKSILLVPIVGGYNIFDRSQCIKHAMVLGEKSCGGYFLEGFHNNGVSATEVRTTELLPIITHCMDQLDVDKPKMMPGAYTPLVMLELVRLGVDMFDTSYAYCAAVNFQALTFHFNSNAEPKCSIGSPFLDLTDESLKEEFMPLLRDCSCMTCQQHTRAYVHHLYKTKELLGPILLMIHNLHHFMQFFEVLRATIATDNLIDLIKLIKFQATDKEINYRIYENIKVISKAGLEKGFVSAT